MDTKEFLKKLCTGYSVSGHEYSIEETIKLGFKKYADNINVDKLGNIIIIKKGQNNISKLKIMIAAHMDEIGLIVKSIEKNGFIKFTNVGGIDPKTIIGQEVIVHGEKPLFGVVVSKPPHLQEASESEKVPKLEDLYIDLGYDSEKLKEYISVGDVITINREFKELKNDKVTGKSLDNKAGIAVMYESLKILNKTKHKADLYFVCTVQEEVGLRGACTSTYSINPDIGIAIDVGFGSTPELPKYETIDLGKGPGITIGGTIHPKLREKMVEVAKEYNIPFQYEVSPSSTGTDADVIQLTREGIPTLCLSIPLRYMHTSVEVVNIKDIENTAKLLAFFIASISENLEGLLCY
ncbi:MAG: M42 family metallopeptidase [Tissierellia bacterium]|nr:M42 family metallopeptidase [Tissierellia bacterium]